MYTARYIDPTTDFGFKRLFGQEDSKELLKHFLHAVLDLPAPIADLRYLPSEQVPTLPDDRLSIYDVYCVDTDGRRFIVEMQRNRQAYFKERALYYATFPIIQQVQKGEEGSPFAMLPIYITSVLNFRMDTEPAYLRRVQLTDVQSGRVFYDKLTFTYIELPKFTTPLEALETPVERWLYLLRHLPDLADIPSLLAMQPYTRAFSIAEHANLSSAEQERYEASLKRVRDDRSLYLTGRSEGRKEGLSEGRKEGLSEGLSKGRKEREREIARTLLASGLPPAEVARITGLDPAELESL